MFALGGMLLVLSVVAKKPELYRCLQKDGTVVIQDRMCMVTDLQKAPTKPENKPLKPTLKSKKESLGASVTSVQKSSFSETKRSPYFTFGWERFIPANWLIYRQKASGYEATWWSETKFTSPADFIDGVVLRVYKNTMAYEKQGAFAQALEHYHGIRDNDRFKLLDSQFKNHNRFKVFNIKYQQPDDILTITEYYIDERHNDLFVLTVQARPSLWTKQWELAAQIIEHF